MAKGETQFLALLRGINVGGKNIIAKDDLRGCFEDLGYSNVRTYIQSGNILFFAAGPGTKTATAKLTSAIESALSKRFSYDAQAVVISHAKYKTAIKAAPENWGTDDDCKHNALFTLSSTTPKRVLGQLDEPKPEIETVTAGPGVIFWSATKQAITKTTLMKLAKHPAYQQVTVRNHNTVYKLLELLEQG